MSNEDVLRAVLASWSEGLEAAAAATREHFADDCVWEQTGIPTTTGPEEAAQLMLGMEAMGFKAIEVDYRNVVAAGDVVCTERVDHIVGLDGTRQGKLPRGRRDRVPRREDQRVARVLRQREPRAARVDSPRAATCASCACRSGASSSRTR